MKSGNGEMDPRVTPLVVIVKYWAQKSRITGAHEHKLSGQLSTVEAFISLVVEAILCKPYFVISQPRF